MPSSALAIARGALAGTLNARREEEERQDRELRKALELSNMEGITIEDPTVPMPAPAAPVAPVVTGTPGSVAGQRSVLDAAHSIWKTSAAGDQPNPAAIAPELGGTKAPPPPPRNAIQVGRVRLNGKDKVVMMDPTQTVGGKRRARELANKDAFDRLNKDGSLGTYEPSFDYQAEERRTIDEKELTDALTAGGMDPGEARTLAKFHVDMEGRRLKANADVRAETRAENLDDMARANLEERRRHNQATEANAADRLAARGGGPLSKNPRIAFQTVEKQIGDTKNAITAARNSFKPTTLGEMNIFNTPADSTAYSEGKARQQENLSALHNRQDSLTKVSDSLAAIIQKSPTASSAAPKGSSTAPSTRSAKAIDGLLTPKKKVTDKAGYTKALSDAATLYQQLLKTPGVDPAEAKTAYDETVASISKKFGALE